MAQKRASSSHDEANDERDLQVPGKRRNGPSELQDTRYLQFLAGTSSNSTNDMEVSLERLFRKLIQERIPPILEEVIPPILQRYLSPCRGLSVNRQIGTPGGRRSLQLCFMNGLPPSGFTQLNIRAEDGSPLQIALCDTTIQHRKVIKEDGPSMKVKLCVLEGGFGSEDWTAEEFNANILSQRQGKPPLLSGDTDVTLKKGVGYLKNVVFTDNSRWTWSGKFRMGVKLWQSSPSIEVDIKEGKSEPIRVKDNRGVAYKKHNRPSLNDEVWRLHKIAKDGAVHNLLLSIGIETVKDLLQLYTTDRASLRQKIGNIPGKSWETMIKQAKACEMDDDERYIYQYFTAERSISLVFDCIYQVIAVSFNGQNLCALDSLDSEEERWVEIVKRQAYNNLKDLKPIDTSPHSLMRTLAAVQCRAPHQDLQHFEFDLSNLQQGQPQMLPNWTQPSTSATATSHNIDEGAHGHQAGSCQLPHQMVEMPLDWSAGEQFSPEVYTNTGENGWPISGSEFDQLASCLVPPTPLEQLNPSNLPCDYGVEEYCNYYSSFPNPVVSITPTSKGKTKKLWNILLNTVKWFRVHAAKRKAKVVHYQY